jgi:hypothetical protein
LSLGRRVMPIDPADVPHIERLKPWIDKANRAIDSAVEHARLHAGRSMTSAVVSADEGRATWRLLRKQKSAKAAHDRLKELMALLVGPGQVSLSGLIQDARAKFYHQAFDHWKCNLPSAVMDPDASPVQSGERDARGLIIHGKSPYKEIEPVFLTASSALTTAMNAAAVKDLDDRTIDGIFDIWENNTAARMYQKVREMLSDSQIAILGMVGQSMVKEEMRNP